MGATSSEILHLLKVKLPLQNDKRWLLLLSWFSKFSRGGPPTPTSRLGNVIFFFNPTLLSKVYNSGLNIRVIILISVKMAIYLLPKDFLYPYYAIVYHSRDLKISIR